MISTEMINIIYTITFYAVTAAEVDIMNDFERGLGKGVGHSLNFSIKNLISFFFYS